MSEKDSEVPAAPHEICVVVGRTGSGKTRLISRVLGPRHPRRITIDVTGECEKLYPAAYFATGYSETLRALEVWAREGHTRWHMVSVLEPEETALLMAELVPVYAPGKSAMAADLGGVCVECSEIDVYLPVSGARSAVSGAWTTALARGRHVGCSVIAATQRPHQVARIVTSQASRVIAFATHEPRDLRFLAQVGGERFARVVHVGLRPFQSAWYDAQTGRVHVKGAEYNVVRTFRAHEDGGDPDQADLDLDGDDT